MSGMADSWKGIPIPVDETDVRPEDTRPESARVMQSWAQLAETLKKPKAGK